MVLLLKSIAKFMVFVGDLYNLRFGPIQHSVSASSPPDRLMSAPWIDGKKHEPESWGWNLKMMISEKMDTSRELYGIMSVIQIWYITYTDISFYGVYFQVPCHFFWEGRMCRWVHLLHKKIWPAQRSQISPQKRHHLRMWHSKNPSSPPQNGIPSFWVAFGHPMLHILKTEGHPLGFLLYYYSFAIQHEGGVVLLIAHAGYKTSLQKPKWNHFRHHKSWLMHYHFIIYENK